MAAGALLPNPTPALSAAKGLASACSSLAPKWFAPCAATIAAAVALRSRSVGPTTAEWKPKDFGTTGIDMVDAASANYGFENTYEAIVRQSYQQDSASLVFVPGRHGLPAHRDYRLERSMSTATPPHRPTSFSRLQLPDRSTILSAMAAGALIRQAPSALSATKGVASALASVSSSFSPGLLGCSTAAIVAAGALIARCSGSPNADEASKEAPEVKPGASTYGDASTQTPGSDVNAQLGYVPSIER